MCCRFNEPGLAQLEYNMNDPNVLNAHRVAKGWKQEVTVKVEYDLIRPDGSKINLHDLDGFAYGSLWMQLGNSNGADGYVTFDHDDIHELSSNEQRTWVDGSRWTEHGRAAGDFDLKWITHMDSAGNEFMQVTAIRTPYNTDWENERELF